MIDPRPSIVESQPVRGAAGGGIHDGWRSVRGSNSVKRPTASRQALTPPVQASDGIYDSVGGWGHTQAQALT